MRHLLTDMSSWQVDPAFPDRRSGWSVANQVVRVFRSGRVRRYHIHELNQPQNVADHSFGVAAMVCVIWPYASAELVKAAIFHDVAEFKTGDMPGPTKREFPQLKEGMDLAEKAEILDMGLIKYHEDNLSKEDKKKLKSADYLEAMIFCMKEVYGGNRELEYAVNNCFSYIKEQGLQEVIVIAEILYHKHQLAIGGKVE